jgi:hypothetical protein
MEAGMVKSTGVQRSREEIISILEEGKASK